MNVRKFLNKQKNTLLFDVPDTSGKLLDVCFHLISNMFSHRFQIFLIGRKLQLPECICSQLFKIAILEHFHLCHPGPHDPAMLLLFQNYHYFHEGGL
jgi:hypothetical protein